MSVSCSCCYSKSVPVQNGSDTQQHAKKNLHYAPVSERCFVGALSPSALQRKKLLVEGQIIIGPFKLERR